MFLFGDMLFPSAGDMGSVPIDEGREEGGLILVVSAWCMGGAGINTGWGSGAGRWSGG